MAEKYPSGEKEKGRGGYTYVCIFTYDVSVDISYAIQAYSYILKCMHEKETNVCCICTHQTY
jgi:hypothetical protein